MNNKDFLEKLGLNIKIERVRKKFTQEDLAELADCDRTYISLVERGKQNPSITNVVKIAKALEVDILTILSGLL